MNLVVAVDREWGIGYQGNLLVAVKEDLSRFRKMTLGKTVVYGSATLRTFHNGGVLKDRKNLILSKNSNFKVEGAIILHSIEELIAKRWLLHIRNVHTSILSEVIRHSAYCIVNGATVVCFANVNTLPIRMLI